MDRRHVAEAGGGQRFEPRGGEQPAAEDRRLVPDGEGQVPPLHPAREVLGLGHALAPQQVWFDLRRYGRVEDEQGHEQDAHEGREQGPPPEEEGRPEIPEDGVLERELTLVPGALVIGTVRTRPGGASVAGARVVLFQPESRDPGARFKRSRIPAYRLSFRSESSRGSTVIVASAGSRSSHACSSDANAQSWSSRPAYAIAR